MPHADAEPPRKLAQLKRSEPKQKAVGVPAVVNSLLHTQRQAGLTRGAQALLGMNQAGGFDCRLCLA